MSMAGSQDELEIKFRLSDGSDIGPKSYASATSIATLKENVLAQWPKDKEYGPRSLKDVKLISGGRILENNKTVGECQSPLCNLPGGGVTTMHVVVQPPTAEKDKKVASESKQNKCLCYIIGSRLNRRFPPKKKRRLNRRCHLFRWLKVTLVFIYIINPWLLIVSSYTNSLVAHLTITTSKELLNWR